ncbi:D-aspartate oxidase-like isoform X3 [Biomphalaria glabrata]|uniref:D-aspartate oxidase-like isoform X3 n=1 Tax=Biomphalaria glabrata TaxID=6526 RepID=A0A9W3AV09_BIOGL|nr:D-aspartate oxidase-like isoform X3 [Biomphalaria glabrata]
MTTLSVAVIGAGVVGLSSAINIQKLIPRVMVTIIADSFGRDTSSPVDPGIFLPIPSKMIMDQVLVREWLIDSWKHHFEKANSSEGKLSGQTFMYGHCLWSTPYTTDYILPTLVLDYKNLSKEEILQLGSNHGFGARFKTVVVNRETYLPALMKEFRMLGGKVVFDTVYSVQELYGKYDIVVNCTGNRARTFLHDPHMYPVKCHAIQVMHEWTKEFLITEDNISVIPDAETNVVDVGFYAEPDEYTADVDQEIIALMYNKIKSFVPHLVGAEVIRKWAARKPHREPPLVEIEMARCYGGPVLPVVHIVALGTSTYSLAWGAGCHAAHLVQDIGRMIKPFAWVWRPFMMLG